MIHADMVRAIRKNAAPIGIHTRVEDELLPGPAFIVSGTARGGNPFRAVCGASQVRCGGRLSHISCKARGRCGALDFSECKLEGDAAGEFQAAGACAFRGLQS